MPREGVDEAERVVEVPAVDEGAEAVGGGRGAVRGGLGCGRGGCGDAGDEVEVRGPVDWRLGRRGKGRVGVRGGEGKEGGGHWGRRCGGWRRGGHRCRATRKQSRRR